MDNLDLIWNSSLEELKRGYIQEEDQFVCLLCGETMEKGIVYSEEGILYEAEKYIRLHIKKTHQSVFDHLIQLDKKLTGLTDHQNKLLRLFYQGKSDGTIQREMGIGSVSTIRNHRFVLKEKERQAKLFLAMMELLREESPSFLNTQKSGKSTADRDQLTLEENERIIRKYFPQGTDGPLRTTNIKEKHRVVALQEIANRFEQGRTYTEKEINEILKTVYPDDPVTIRRYLIDYGIMDRKPDGSEYWLKEEKNMNQSDRKAEAKLRYKHSQIKAGVYQIKNTVNQKMYVYSTMNLKSMQGKQFELEIGTHPNKNLQDDWNKYGKDAFTFDILEIVDDKDNSLSLNDKKAALEKLEEKWLNELQPYGERGYNSKKSSQK